MRSSRARTVLGVIRLINGAAALAAPERVASRLGAPPNGPTTYALRLFGVRTVVIGADLLRRDERELEHTLRAAVLIHASDTIAAVVAGARGQLPRRTAALMGAISAVNVSLALHALLGDQRV
jgi:hypothetical protein